MGEHAIGGNKAIDAAALAAAQSGGELKRVESAKATCPGMTCQQELSANEIYIQDPFGDKPSRIGARVNSAEKYVRAVKRHRSGPHFNGGSRSEFHQCQPRRKDAISTGGKDRIDHSRPLLEMEPFRQGAGVKEIQQRSVFSAFLNNQIGPGTLIVLQQFLQLLGGESRLSALRHLRLALRQILMVNILIVRFDRQRDTFRIVKRHVPNWSQDAVLEYGFHSNRHALSLRDSAIASPCKEK